MGLLLIIFVILLLVGGLAAVLGFLLIRRSGSAVNLADVTDLAHRALKKLGHYNGHVPSLRPVCLGCTTRFTYVIKKPRISLITRMAKENPTFLSIRVISDIRGEFSAKSLMHPFGSASPDVEHLSRTYCFNALPQHWALLPVCCRRQWPLPLDAAYDFQCAFSVSSII